MPTGQEPVAGCQMKTIALRPYDTDRARTSPRSTESEIIRLRRTHRAVLASAGLMAVLLLFNGALTLQSQPPRPASPPENAPGIWVGGFWPFRYDGDTVYLHPWP
jgi:hypothetical protein